MAIRRETNPRELNLQPELQDILRRNGMQAFIAETPSGYQLVVQGHDSPMLSYSLNQAQLSALIDWGTNYANRKAYNTFTQIVKGDFDMPRDFVHARNANGRVAMGLHGYRIGVGEYGRQGMTLPMAYGAMHMPTGRWPHYGWYGACHRHLDPGGFFRPFLGWTPRQQEGFHLRRIGGNLYYPGAPMVYDRPTGRKPGELQSGGYGFYWKGQQPQPFQYPQQDVLAQLQTVVQPIPTVERPNIPAKPYSQVITSDVYFSTDKWLEVLESHGIVIDSTNSIITIQSASLPADMQYDLKPEELALLTSNSLDEHSLDERIKVINDIISVDFDSKLTKEMLNGDKLIALDAKPELMAEMTQYLYAEQNRPQGVESGISIIPARTNALAIPLSQAIDSPKKYDTYKWVEVLASHGIVLDPANKTMTIQSSEVGADLIYQLSDNDYAVITNPSYDEHDFDLRVQVINDNIGKDFATPLTVEMLDTDRLVPLKLKPEAEQILSQQIQSVSATPMQGRERSLGLPEDNREGVVTMDGYDLYLIDESKGWYREGNHGREVAVDGIRVTPKDTDGKYRMTAVIDGKTITREISEKDYNKFLVLDDYHRFKLFSKIFKEVDIKNNPDYQRGDGISTGAKIGLGLLAGLTVAGEVIHGLRGPGPGRPCPEFYGSGPYFKPGVDSPADISHRAFEAGMNTERMHQDLNHGR